MVSACARAQRAAAELSGGATLRTAAAASGLKLHAVYKLAKAQRLLSRTHRWLTPQERKNTERLLRAARLSQHAIGRKIGRSASIVNRVAQRIFTVRGVRFRRLAKPVMCRVCRGITRFHPCVVCAANAGAS